MANIAKLNVHLVANASRFRRGLGAARTDLQKFSKSTRVFGASIASSMTRSLRYATIGSTALAASLGVLAARQAKFTDANGKLARTLGLSYNKLRQLQLGAGQAGIETEALNKSFEKMSDTVGAAMFGDSAAIDAFKKIGMTVEDLDRLRPEQRFKAIASAIQNIPDPSQRIAAARDIFGKSGGAMLELMRGTNSAMMRAAENLTIFGLRMSELDVSNVERANDGLGEMGLAFEGIGNQINKIASKHIRYLTDSTRDWLKEKGGIESLGNTALPKINSELEKMVNHVESIRNGFGVFGDVAQTFGDMVPNNPKVEGVLGWNPVRDTLGAMFQKRQSDSALARMQDEYNRRMGTGVPPQTGQGKLRAYNDAVEAHAAPTYKMEGPGVNPILNPGALPSPSHYFPAPAMGRLNLGPVFRGWQDKIPSGEPKWKSKIPSGPPAYLEKMSAASAAYTEPKNVEAYTPSALRMNGNQGTGDTETHRLLQELIRVAKEPVLPHWG